MDRQIETTVGQTYKVNRQTEVIKETHEIDR
jgi:hypothetical protein